MHSLDDGPRPAGSQEALMLAQPRAFLHLFDKSPGFVVLLSGSKHRIDYHNTAFAELIGERDIAEKPVAEVLPEIIDQAFLGLLDDVFNNGEPLKVEEARYDRQLEPGGPITELYTDFTLQPVRGDDGQVGGILVHGHEVTGRVVATQAVFEAQALAEAASADKADFVSHLSHDIRSPMNAVVSLASILASTQPLSTEQREYVRLLLVSADTVVAQVSDMVDRARIEARVIDLDNVAFSPAEVIQDTAAVLAAPALDKGLNLLVDDGGDGVQVVGDPVRVRQIVTHLTANAIHFTQKGEVTIAVRCMPGDAPGMAALFIDVSDTGPGMDAEAVTGLFEDGDTGDRRDYDEGRFSLAMAKALVEMMGGSVAVKSAPGKGTTFTVRLVLPAVGWDTPEETAAAKAEAEIVQPEGLPPILVVEDYEPNILVATTFLKRFGFRVDVATNGRDAVEKARSGNYLLALMDVQMPGINGLEATKLIRRDEAKAQSGHLPIIGVTAHSLAVDRERCLAAGMDSFLSKPFTAADLHDRIRSVMPLVSQAS